MAISSVLNSTANSYVKSTATSSAKSTTANNAPESNASSTTSDVSSTSSAFGEMVTQASLSSVPSKTLSPEVLAATVPSTTIQTSGYVFDPLGVVGTVPESNTFLQAIRQMMGKPLVSPATETAPAAPATVAASSVATTAAALSTFGALPAATSAQPTPAPKPAAQTKASPAGSLPTEVGSTQAAAPSVADFMSSIEAQLSYQVGTTTATMQAAQSTGTALSSETTTSAAQAGTTSGIVDQYLAGNSAAASAIAQSELASALDKEAQQA